MDWKKIFIVYSLVFFPGCRKDPSVWKIENLNGNKISVFGHGGMGEHYRFPMNSYESLTACLDLETDGTEMDVCVTKDSVLVLCHTQNLEDDTDCSGLIKDKSWSDIQDCQLKTPLFSKAKLIQASYFFDRIENKNNKTFTFDCKTINYSPEYLELFATALVKHIDKYKLASSCYIESFDVDFLKILYLKNAELRLFLYTDECQIGIETSKSLPLYGITMDTEKISAEEIKQAHQQNLRVTLFNTSTEHDNLEAIQKNPDNIQTDKVAYLLNALKE